MPESELEAVSIANKPKNSPILYFVTIFVVVALLLITYKYAYYKGLSEKGIGKGVSSRELITDTVVDKKLSSTSTTSPVLFSGEMPNILVKINGKIYDKRNPLEVPQPLQYVDESRILWKDISNSLKGITPDDTLFDLAFNPNDTVGEFILVTRSISNNKTVYKVFDYSLVSKLGKLLVTSDSFTSGKVLRIAYFEQGGKVVILNGFGCWGCGGTSAKKYMVNTENGKVKNLGVVEDLSCTNFECTKYRFKVKKEINCKLNNVVPNIGEGGICYEELESTPFQYGTF